MGREVVMVAKDFDWKKYRDKNLFMSMTYKEALEDYEEYPDDWGGEKPNPDEFLPDWKDEERTHYCMFSSTTDSPISPPFATPEELADWLVKNKVSVFAFQTATKEEWLKIINAKWIPTGVFCNGSVKVGADTIDACKEDKTE